MATLSGSVKGLSFSSSLNYCPASVSILNKVEARLSFIVSLLNQRGTIFIKFRLKFDKLTLEVRCCISDRKMVCIKLYGPHCTEHEERHE